MVDPEKANLVDIYLVSPSDGELDLAAENREGRTCVGMALFTISQRPDFVSEGDVTLRLDPDLAAVRAWLVPADGDRPAMVQVETETRQIVVPRMLTWLRERSVFPFALSDLEGAGCDAPLAAGAG